MQRRAEREGRKSCDTGWWESHAVVGGPAPDDGGDDAHDDEDKPDLAQNTAHGEPVLVLLVAVAWICARAAGGAVRRVFVTSALGVDTIVVALRTLLPRVALDGVRRLKPAKRGVGRADEKQREAPEDAGWRHNRGLPPLTKFAAFACFHPLTYTIPIWTTRILPAARLPLFGRLPSDLVRGAGVNADVAALGECFAARRLRRPFFGSRRLAGLARGALEGGGLSVRSLCGRESVHLQYLCCSYESAVNTITVVSVVQLLFAYSSRRATRPLLRRHVEAAMRATRPPLRRCAAEAATQA